MAPNHNLDDSGSAYRPHHNGSRRGFHVQRTKLVFVTPQVCLGMELAAIGAGTKVAERDWQASCSPIPREFTRKLVRNGPVLDNDGP